MEEYYYVYNDKDIRIKTTAVMQNMFKSSVFNFGLLAYSPFEYIRCRTVNWIALELHAGRVKMEDVDEEYVKEAVGEVIGFLCETQANFGKIIAGTTNIDDIEKNNEKH